MLLPFAGYVPPWRDPARGNWISSHPPTHPHTTPPCPPHWVPFLFSVGCLRGVPPGGTAQEGIFSRALDTYLAGYLREVTPRGTSQEGILLRTSPHTHPIPPRRRLVFSMGCLLTLGTCPRWGFYGVQLGLCVPSLRERTGDCPFTDFDKPRKLRGPSGGISMMCDTLQLKVPHQVLSMHVDPGGFQSRHTVHLTGLFDAAGTLLRLRVQQALTQSTKERSRQFNIST